MTRRSFEGILGIRETATTAYEGSATAAVLTALCSLDAQYAFANTPAGQRL